MSVIIPTYNNADQLAQCLKALRTAADAGTELIVVDDASRDDVSAVAACAGARFLRLARNSGPSAARNYGARHAQGQILFFVDADVVVAGDALGRVRTVLSRDAEIAAMFGSYDTRPAAPGLISQYRNLLHHFMHQTGKTEAATFWAGCGAVRRSAFEHVGGFDERGFPRWVEDVELGYRLRRAGYRIFLDKALQGTHLKRWTLWSVVRTDIFHRAIPWSRLILDSGEAPDDLNLQGNQKASVVLTGLGGLLLAASPFRLALLLPASLCATAVIVLNRDFYAFLRRLRGMRFAAACVPLHLIYFACCGLGYLSVRLPLLMRSAIRALPGRRRTK
ncbi:MAG TPA: glycosyltransferase [Stellaceae bacterium]|nr:glycosyltransferase [Stellaceae bacterium]